MCGEIGGLRFQEDSKGPALVETTWWICSARKMGPGVAIPAFTGELYTSALPLFADQSLN